MLERIPYYKIVVVFYCNGRLSLVKAFEGFLTLVKALLRDSYPFLRICLGIPIIFVKSCLRTKTGECKRKMVRGVRARDALNLFCFGASTIYTIAKTTI